jgi:hypothetical protein
MIHRYMCRPDLVEVVLAVSDLELLVEALQPLHGHHGLDALVTTQAKNREKKKG